LEEVRRLCHGPVNRPGWSAELGLALTAPQLRLGGKHHIDPLEKY